MLAQHPALADQDYKSILQALQSLLLEYNNLDPSSAPQLAGNLRTLADRLEAAPGTGRSNVATLPAASKLDSLERSWASSGAAERDSGTSRMHRPLRDHLLTSRQPNCGCALQMQGMLSSCRRRTKVGISYTPLHASQAFYALSNGPHVWFITGKIPHAVERTFDMSAYQTRFVALEIFYLGASYHGFASQGDTGPTVEVISKFLCRISTVLYGPHDTAINGFATAGRITQDVSL